MIGKGCTCKNTFEFPFSEGDVEAIRIAYCQDGKVLFEKHKEDCMFSYSQVSVELNQEDTLMFNSSKIIRIQIKVKLTDGSVTKSNIVETITDELLCCEVI